MYFIWKNLGWVNIGLLILVITHFILRRVNKFAFYNKNQFLRKVSSFMAKIHPYLTGFLLLSAFLHGFNLAGGIRFHSGYIAFAAILLQGIFGTLVKFKKKKPILVAHRIFGIILIISVIVHVIIMKT